MTRAAQQPKRQRHVPLRRCVVCRVSRPQFELLRLYQDEVGAWQFDLKRKAGGRGAWLCRDNPSCHKCGALKRFFKQDAERVAETAHTIRRALGFDETHSDETHRDETHDRAQDTQAKGG